MLIVLALSGPRTPDLRTRIDTEGIAVVMALDVSGSMNEKDFDWNGDRLRRLEAVNKAFHLFVEVALRSAPVREKPQRRRSRAGRPI